MTWLSVAAGLVAVVGAGIAYLSYRAADRSAKQSKRSADAAERSAAAAESADRRARIPVLEILRAGPFPDRSDLVIYRIRNNGPSDLDDLVIFRPRPPDRITYAIAVTGSNFAEDEIHLGPVRLTEEVRFTLGCGHAATLPEFHVRIECHAGSDRWELSQSLPPPRLELSNEEKAARRATLSYALSEIEDNLQILSGPGSVRSPLCDENFEAAARLVLAHAADCSGPIRDARRGIHDFRAWIESTTSYPGDELGRRQASVSTLLSAAHALFEDLKAALDTPQASGTSWGS